MAVRRSHFRRAWEAIALALGPGRGPVDRDWPGHTDPPGARRKRWHPPTTRLSRGALDTLGHGEGRLHGTRRHLVDGTLPCARVPRDVDRRMLYLEERC